MHNQNCVSALDLLQDWGGEWKWKEKQGMRFNLDSRGSRERERVATYSV